MNDNSKHLRSDYEAPSLSLLAVRAELGFASSKGSATDDLSVTNQEWGWEE